MFELGKWYRFKMWEDSDDGGIITEYSGKIVDISLPLIKVKDLGDDGPEIVVNTTSLAFVSAQLSRK